MNANDFTEHFEHINRAFAQVYESAKVGQWYNDLTNNLQYYSSSYKSIYELKEVTRDNILSKVHPDDLERVKESIAHARKNLTHFNIEFRLLLGNSIKHLYACGQCLALEDKVVDYGVVIDITERVEKDERLRLLAENLARTNEDLEQFAFIASHDLQEPLRKIRAFGDLLEQEDLSAISDDGRLYLSRMNKSAERMQTLINDLLIFSRASRSKSGFEKVDLQLLVNDVLRDFDDIINETNAIIDVTGLETIDGIPNLLRQVFQNLISNALKFRKPGLPPHIEIFGEKTISAEVLNIGKKIKTLEIIVKDNGIGFDQKYADKIFTIFGRLHGRSEYEGTGIGLALCKKVIEHHHGFIEARSEPGGGAEFRIIFPLKQKKKWRERI